MAVQFSTRAAAAPNPQQAWRELIDSVYFQLQVDFRQPETFDGQLECWQLGDLSLSYLRSDPAQYTRQRNHLAHSRSDEAFLVTVPVRSEVRFRQLGREVACQRGDFLLELSHEPYQFDYHEANELWVLKIPHTLMKQYVHHPERYGALSFDGQQGLGHLFSQYLRLTGEQLRQQPPDHSNWDWIGMQLLSLFSHVAHQDERVLHSSESSVRSAHLRRIEDYARKHLSQPQLTPDEVAQACRISTRYLHDLFQDTGTTFGRWLTVQRLQSAHDTLTQAHCKLSLANLAYQWGFTDQAHFSRAFKKQFGYSPKEVRPATAG